MAQPSLILTDNPKLHMDREVERAAVNLHFGFLGNWELLSSRLGSSNFTTATLLEGELEEVQEGAEERTRWGIALDRALHMRPDSLVLSGEQILAGRGFIGERVAQSIAMVLEAGSSVALVYPAIPFKEIVRQSSRVRAMIPTDLQPSIVFFGD